MYQVVTMYGDNEPWWFFEDWEKDIQSEVVFGTFSEAANYYCQQWQKLRGEYPHQNSKENFLAAFWDETDERWCEECDDYLQEYLGLALLKDHQAVSQKSADLSQQVPDAPKTRCCQRLNSKPTPV